MNQWESDVARMAKKLRKIAAIEVPRASSSALNKVAAMSKTRVKKGVSARTKIPQKHINKKIFIRKSTARTQVAKVDLYRDDISLGSLLTAGNITKRLSPPGGRRRRHLPVRWGGKRFAGFVGVRRPDGFAKRVKNAIKGKKRKASAAQVFKRKTSSQYPLEAIKVPIKKDVDTVAGVVMRRVMKSEYPRLLKHELDYRIKKYEEK